MRRPFNAINAALLAALLAVGALAAAAGSPSAAGATPPIICPLASQIATCCGPPVNSPAATPIVPCCTIGTVCCPGTIVCVAPMTIASSPNPSVAGSAVTISGVVTGGAAGSTVALWQELPGQKSFHQVASVTTSSSGAYKLRRPGSTVKTDRAWYVASGGAKSVTIDQVVKAKVTISARASKPSGAHKVSVTGKVDPSHSGQRVLLEQRIGGKWRVLGHARLSKKSRYAISHRWAHAGAVKLRISLGADKQNAASLSPVATVTVS